MEQYNDSCGESTRRKNKKKYKKPLDVYFYQMNFTVKTVIGDCKKFLISGEEKCAIARMWHGNRSWSTETATAAVAASVLTSARRLQIRLKTWTSHWALRCLLPVPASDQPRCSDYIALNWTRKQHSIEKLSDIDNDSLSASCDTVISLATFHLQLPRPRRP